METALLIYNSEVFSVAFGAFVVTGLIAGFFSWFTYRGIRKDRDLLKFVDEEEFDDQLIKASIIWCRQDLAQSYGMLGFIASLLGAILVVLIVKL